MTDLEPNTSASVSPARRAPPRPRSRLGLGLNLLAAGLLLSGCASYQTPGGPAPFGDMKGATIAGGAMTQPSLNIPSHIVIAHVQAAGYKSLSSQALGDGRFGFVGGDDSPSSAQIQSVDQWPSVAAADALDPTLLPETVNSLEDLRLAAAKIQADVLFVYTFDTGFEIEGERSKPAAKLKLGEAPATAAITSKASALFIDVRTGYVYGKAGGDATVGDLGTAWQADTTLDARRIAAEQQAFTALATNAEQIWAGIAGPVPQ